jgi:hypothetical protein
MVNLNFILRPGCAFPDSLSTFFFAILPWFATGNDQGLGNQGGLAPARRQPPVAWG